MRAQPVWTKTASGVLHPQVDDLSGPEIALLGGFEDGSWMCLQPGEESFEYLAQRTLKPRCAGRYRL